MTWEEAHRRCSEGIVPACHNSLDSVTVSGPAESVTTFVAELQNEGVFAKAVHSVGIAFHSPCISTYASALKQRLQQVSFPVLLLLRESFQHGRMEVCRGPWTRLKGRGQRRPVSAETT